MEPERDRLQRGLVAAFGVMYRESPGARYEPRGDYLFLLQPKLPIPMANGVWIERDSEVAAAELAGAVAEVEAVGTAAWVTSRPGDVVTQEAACAAGLTAEQSVPGMACNADELKPAARTIDVDLVDDASFEAALDVSARSFEAPHTLFRDFWTDGFRQAPEVRWYLGRDGNMPVTTALSVTIGADVGLFNVGTPREHRGKGYAAAVTSYAVEQAIAAGAEFCFLQSSSFGHGVYERLGFRDITQYTLQSRPA